MGRVGKGNTQNTKAFSTRISKQGAVLLHYGTNLSSKCSLAVAWGPQIGQYENWEIELHLQKPSGSHRGLERRCYDLLGGFGELPAALDAPGLPLLAGSAQISQQIQAQCKARRVAAVWGPPPLPTPPFLRWESSSFYRASRA